MNSNQFDLAVFGSSPQALFLAALMAENQSRRIVLLHNPGTRVRLIRELDLSFAAVTRPETWRLLSQGVEETRRYFARADLAQHLERCDLLLVRSGETGRAELGHVRAMAGAHGIAVEPFAAAPIAGWDEAGWPPHALLVRDVWRFAAERAHDGFAAWHERLGVRRIAVGDVDEATFSRDGSVRLSAGDERIGAEATVLADDDAIAAHANAADIESTLGERVATAMLTEPAGERLPGRVPVVVGEDFTAHLRGSGALYAAGSGAGGPLAERVLRLLPAFENARLAGRARYHALQSLDGAPVAGRGRTRRSWIVGGMAPLGLFLMPSVARVILDAADAGEAAYWAGRGPSRGGQPVADIGSSALPGAA